MAFQDTNNLVDTIVDTQKKVLDSVVETTKKFTNSNNPLNDSIEKGTDWYKNWLESQKTLYTKTTAQASAAADTTSDKDTTAKANEFFDQWMTMQANLAKQMWETAQESAKKFATGTNGTNPFTAGTNPFTAGTNPFMANNPFAATNPFANWQNNFSNMQNPWNGFMNNMPNANWMSQMQNMNPFQNNMEEFKKATETTTGMFNQYYTMLNNSFGEWQKSFENGTVQDAYKNMMNSGESFAKFAEIWTPMFKSIQDKTFSMDEYKKFMNPELYKELMDKFFGFLPEASRQQLNNMTAQMNENMKKMSENGMNSYNQMRENMSKMGNGSEMFGKMQGAFEQMTSMMNEAAAPFAKMITPNQHTKMMAEWKDLSSRIATYNLKNSELQYMIYTQGTKVMDKLAENIAKKVQDGTEVTSMLALYQEWLNISDKVYVSLFESTEYSEKMGEVSSLQNKLRRDIDLQMEKMFKDIPVATRSEMDEVYKTIYELKKKVRQLEKMLDLEGEEKEEKIEEPKVAKATKSAKK